MTDQTTPETNGNGAMLPATVESGPMNFKTMEGFKNLQRVAKLFCESALVPKDYQGLQGVASCAIALDLANRIDAAPLQVMQNLYIVQGKPAWSAKFLIATFNQCGRYTSIRYDFVGEKGTDDWGCRAYATELATGELLEGPVVTMGIAKAEGWLSKNGSKWRTMPEQMLRYRSAAWFINTVAPELAMGLPTDDEAVDISEAVKMRPQTPYNPQHRMETDWTLAEIEAFDTMMDQIFTAFKDAGYSDDYKAFSDIWRPRRGKGVADEVLVELNAQLDTFAGKAQAQEILVEAE